MSRVYIAAPFFTPMEIGVVQTIENMLDEFGIPYFSPRKDGGNDSRQGSVRENAKAIFEANIEALQACNKVLAVLDRFPADNQEVWLCERDVHDILLPVRGPLKQPDIGTVWELGYFAALRYAGLTHGDSSIFGFTRVARNYSSMNVMILEGVDAVCYGLEELAMALSEQLVVYGYHRRLVDGRIVSESGDFKGVRHAI